MRKFFTSLAATALAGCFFAANAEQITLTPSVYEDDTYVYYNEQTAELTRNEDGTYTIADFLGSGKPVTFTFEEPTWGGTSLLTIVNADEEDDYLIYDGENFTITVSKTLEETTEGGETTTIEETKQFEDVWYYADSYTYVDKYTYVNALLNGYKYDAQIFLGTDDGNYIPVGFKFGEVEMPEAVETEAITLRPSVSLNSKKVICDDTFEAQLLKFEDGNYCIPDFIGTGKPIVFSVASDPSGDYGYFQIKVLNSDNIKIDDTTTYRYLYSGGGRYSATLEYNGAEHEFTDIRWFSNVKYTYSEDLSYFDDYEKAALLRFYGMTDDVETRFYVEFYYGKYEPVEEIGEAEDITILPQIWNTESEEYVDYAKPVESKVNKYTKNIYGIENFLGSGQPLDFTFEDPEAGESAYITIKQSYLYYADSDPYLYGTGYFTIKLDKIVDAATDTYEEVEISYVEYSPDYTYVYKYTDEEALEYGYQYCFYMYAFGYEGDDYSDDVLLSFDFGKVDNGTVGVSEVNSNNSAAVEFYNINGMRVENPSNGIFIRKQGSDVKKVVIR